jgi:DNA-binding NarL/FixJ family response regulator
VSIRVLIVDDEEMVRDGFRMILETQPDLEVVGEAVDGAAAVALSDARSPDVVLMDIRMRGMDGLEATRRIMSTMRAPPKIVVLTTFDYDEYVYGALKAGASAFLLKDSPRDQLTMAIRVVAAGDALLHPAITRRLIADFATRPMPGSGTPDALAELTPRELDVIRQVARGRSNREIASALFMGEGTVKTHVAHILAKLELRDRTQIVVAAYETGLVQAGQE